MKARIIISPKTNMQHEFSEIIITPESNEECANLRWVEEVFDMKSVKIIPRFNGDEFHYAIIPDRRK